ncbi:hypothetical protein Daus18300_000163 [Diaporthe australafricana]|uniref:Uncharacterized protein n=1 Tax=Diaporthe australafricana TaxID=127596 RepID=A0ABR3Y7P7_9PEZI
MDVNRRARSPDFAAEEAECHQKLAKIFQGLQTRYEGEKISNLRAFERDQQAVQQSIRDLEERCCELSEKRREIEDAQKNVEQELKLRREEEAQVQIAYHGIEERRRSKYIERLEGDPMTGLVNLSTPHLDQYYDQLSVSDAGQSSGRGPDQFPSGSHRQAGRDVDNLDHESNVVSGALDGLVDTETEHNQLGNEMEAVALSTRTSDGEESSQEQTSDATHRGSTVADDFIMGGEKILYPDECQQPCTSTEVRRGKRNRLLTTKASVLRSNSIPHLGLGDEATNSNDTLPADGQPSKSRSPEANERRNKTLEAIEPPKKRLKTTKSGRVTDGKGIIFPNLQNQAPKGPEACPKTFAIPGVGTLFQKKLTLLKFPWVAVMVLPADDLDKVGLSGHLSDTVLLTQKAKPQCFSYSGERITGWAQGYEDGGPFVNKRWLPCLHFDDSFHVPLAETKLDISDIPFKYSISWIPSNTIIPLDLDAHGGGIFGLESAKKFKARLDVINERRAQSYHRADSMHDDALGLEKDQTPQEQGEESDNEQSQRGNVSIHQHNQMSTAGLVLNGPLHANDDGAELGNGKSSPGNGAGRLDPAVANGSDAAAGHEFPGSSGESGNNACPHLIADTASPDNSVLIEEEILYVHWITESQRKSGKFTTLASGK